MKYPEMKTLYPDLDSMMEKVANIIHGGVSDLMAFGIAESWIRRTVAKDHQQAVTEKFEDWIKAVKPCYGRRCDEILS